MADPWTLRRGRQNLLWAYLCGLVFLIFPAVALVADQPSPNAVDLAGHGAGGDRRGTC